MNLNLTIAKEGDMFVVDNPSVAGSPYVGRGRTMLEAIGRYFHNNQTELGINFTVDETAQPAEDRRRARELAKR